MRFDAANKANNEPIRQVSLSKMAADGDASRGAGRNKSAVD